MTLLTEASEALSSTSDSPRLDAEVLLCHVLKCDRAKLFAESQLTLTTDQKALFSQWISRRTQGEPIAYIVGVKEFWSLSLEVTKDTLIPRPETECLVEWILKNFSHQKLKIADLGTGSGAIALAIASERPEWQITATDKSASALAVAERNAAKLGLNQVSFQQGVWCQALNERNYDVIVSNPPYIASDDSHLDQLKFEPIDALVTDKNGLAAFHNIINDAPKYLRSGGTLVLEHGFQQADAVMALLKDYNYIDIASHCDYAANPRFVTARSRG